MKGGIEHRVPLSKQALAILDQMKGNGSDYVFPSTIESQGLSNMAMLKLLARMDRADITVHGFRSAFRDWAAERTSYPNHVVEKALAHVVGDKVEAAYRRGDLFDKRRRHDVWHDGSPRSGRPDGGQARAAATAVRHVSLLLQHGDDGRPHDGAATRSTASHAGNADAPAAMITPSKHRARFVGARDCG
jgi:hypothetical protein